MTPDIRRGSGLERRRCGCCGRELPVRELAELGQTPGVFICAACALWAARRAGPLSALRQLRYLPWGRLTRRFRQFRRSP